MLASRLLVSVTASARSRSSTLPIADKGVCSGSRPDVSTALICSTILKKSFNWVCMADPSAGDSSSRARCAMRLTSSGDKGMGKIRLGRRAGRGSRDAAETGRRPQKLRPAYTIEGRAWGIILG
jgi:hypothetical protein